MSAAEDIALVKERFGERVLAAEAAEVKDPYVQVEREDLVELLTFLRNEPKLDYDLLHCLTAVDYPGESRFELVYHLSSVKRRADLTVKVALPRDDPHAPTVENLYRTADWHEREAYDLMGIIFDGHHDLRRILCAEDWEGYPLRKDYEMPKSFHGIPNEYEMFYDVENP